LIKQNLYSYFCFVVVVVVVDTDNDEAVSVTFLRPDFSLSPTHHRPITIPLPSRHSLFIHQHLHLYLQKNI